jgi:uncharacterized membrane protein YccC
MHDDLAEVSSQRLLGQLIAKQDLTHETVAKQTRHIEDLTRSIGSFEHKLNTLSDGLVLANKDILTISKSCITPDKLRLVGIDIIQADQHRLDMAHLRDLRENHEEKKAFWSPVKIGIVIAIATALLTWVSK